MSSIFKYVQYFKLFFFNDNFVSFTLKKLGNVETQLVMWIRKP